MSATPSSSIESSIGLKVQQDAWENATSGYLLATSITRKFRPYRHGSHRWIHQYFHAPQYTPPTRTRSFAHSNLDDFLRIKTNVAIVRMTSIQKVGRQTMHALVNSDERAFLKRRLPRYGASERLPYLDFVLAGRSLSLTSTRSSPVRDCKIRHRKRCRYECRVSACYPDRTSVGCPARHSNQ